MKPNFSGYASKAGLKCSDGRTILAHAFKSNDGERVPLLWNHMHDDPENVLGHAIIEDREDGTYVRGYFNTTPKAQAAKTALEHGDFDSLSVFANKLIQKGSEVVHGTIKEVSLVLAGANPGAKIENVAIAHGDDISEIEDEAIITTGLTISHADDEDSSDDSADTDSSDSEDELTVEDVYNTLTDDQKKIVEFIVGSIADAADDEDDDDTDDSDDKKDDSDKKDAVQHSETDSNNQEESTMTHTVFDQKSKEESGLEARQTLSHSQIKSILDTAKLPGHTLKSSVIQHAAEYGIDNIDYLFPDAKLIANQPEMLSRQMEWVQEVIGKTKHSPFSRIKTLVADITAEEARAKGYVKGNLKKEEIVKLLKRKTEPTTIYKKQKLDRDDILDITDLDVVAWLKAEMLLMLNEEIARAILLGDGRAYSDEDKIDEDRIRPIANDDPMYAHPVTVAADATPAEVEEALIRAQNNYRGSGSPVYFTTREELTNLLLQKDTLGRRIYSTVTELASALLVSKIIPVEPMEEYQGLVGVVVNLNDYVVGADKGGAIATFEDFDIDYNQHKYLSETRISGALVKPKAALVVRRAGGTSVNPTSPSFDGAENEITIPSTTGVIYSIEGATVSGVITIDRDTQVDARPAPGYEFPSGATDSWTFVYTP